MATKTKTTKTHATKNTATKTKASTVCKKPLKEIYALVVSNKKMQAIAATPQPNGSLLPLVAWTKGSIKLLTLAAKEMGAHQDGKDPMDFSIVKFAKPTTFKTFKFKPLTAALT